VGVREPVGGARDRVQKRRVLELKHAVGKLQPRQDGVDMGGCVRDHTQTNQLIYYNYSPHLDADFECMTVLIEHT
jgi:hypothetical protein